ncbi:hypothetical protein J6590_044877 [Homalodisca vitripennis]|nr:hypothetical protein J6590_044877 [Homalodisca vitripennis]
MLPPDCTPPSHPTTHQPLCYTVITHPSVAACVCLFSAVTNKITRHQTNSFLNSNPKVVEEKKRAWDIIAEEYSRGTGKQFTIAQLNKLLVNMKSHIKKKNDLKERLLLLSQEENPVFKKVPGATSVGIMNRESLVVPNDDEGTSTGRNSSASSTSKSTSLTYVRAGVKSINKYETDKTKELSLPQLQRLVLLKQLELQNMKIEKEKREAENNKVVEKSTQADYK